MEIDIGMTADNAWKAAAEQFDEWRALQPAACLADQ